VYTGDPRNLDVARDVSGMWTSMQPSTRRPDAVGEECCSASLDEAGMERGRTSTCASISSGYHQGAVALARARRHSAAHDRDADTAAQARGLQAVTMLGCNEFASAPTRPARCAPARAIGRRVQGVHVPRRWAMQLSPLQANRR
jgi:hypothetical protein